MNFHPKEFFDLREFTHQALFNDKKYVWEALIDLKDYLNVLVSGQDYSPSREGVFFENSKTIFLGEGVRIERGAYIQGPCWIGEGSVIRSGAYIREYVITGKNCVIGHGTEVKHSIFFNDVFASHFNYVGDSILGNGVNLGAGAKCANLRFDRQSIRIHFEKNKIETRLKKMGAILGDNAQMGCNSVSNPGTVFFPNTTCAPCMNVGGVLISSLKH